MRPTTTPQPTRGGPDAAADATETRHRDRRGRSKPNEAPPADRSATGSRLGFPTRLKCDGRPIPHPRRDSSATPEAAAGWSAMGGRFRIPSRFKRDGPEGAADWSAMGGRLRFPARLKCDGRPTPHPGAARARRRGFSGRWR
nr:hypothetical protein GCM10020063_078690 [Dactylosporangium thailandense]